MEKKLEKLQGQMQSWESEKKQMVKQVKIKNASVAKLNFLFGYLFQDFRD